ncbi:SCO4848 family membrane protein, partial [Streptomyces sp. MCAF7]
GGRCDRWHGLQRVVKNLWKDSSGLAFDDVGDPTAYFWVHLLLAITSFLLGTGIGVIGLRGLRALRHEDAAEAAEAAEKQQQH